MTIEVTLPSGSVAEFPDGTDPALMQARAQQLAAQERFTNTAKASGPLDNINAAIGGVFQGMGIGARKLGSFTGLTNAPAPQDVQEWKQAMAGLGSTISGKIGTFLGGTAAAAPALMLAGASIPAAAATGGILGALQPSEDTGEFVKNVGLGAGTSAIGQGVGNWLAQYGAKSAAGAQTALAEQKAANAVRDQALQDVRSAGYVVPPTMANQESAPLATKITEGLSGKAATQQAASIRNQALTDALARSDIGLPAGAPLTDATLEAVRKQAGQAYKAVADSGVPIAPTADYTNRIAAVFKPYNDVAAQVPSMRLPEVEALQNDLLAGKTFDPNTVVELVKRLRQDGFNNIYKQGNQTLGHIQLGAQSALEDLLDQNLSQANQPGLLQALQQARQLIAKTYTIQSALGEDGHVIAKKIGDEATGQLATARTLGQVFPKAAQAPSQIGSMHAVSPLDMIVSTVLGAAGAHGAGPEGFAAGALWPMARMGARSLVLSKPWQNAYAVPPEYTRGLLGTLLTDAAQNPYVGLLGRSAATSAAIRNVGQ